MLAVTALALAACSSSDDGSEGTTTTTTVVDHTYPGDEWATVAPGDAGFDAAGLDRLAAQAEAAGSSCLVVTRDGEVVDERYWQGTTADTPRQAWSVTKSITSTLVGIAQDQGDLDVTDSAADHIPEWQGTDAAAVTIENLLSGDSGRHWDFGTDYGEMAIEATDKTAFAIGLAQDDAPGEVWAYNNSAIQTLSAVLESATGQSPVDFARTQLFEPLGMRHSELTTDAAGNALTYAGLQTTCLDLARFGYLMLRDGAWDGEQVVSSDYVEQATGTSSTPLNAAYGWLWWLNHQGPIGSPQLATTGIADATIADGQLAPGAPGDVFWALGFNNQMITVIPSEGVVAVRMGARPPEQTPFTESELTMGVLDAQAAP
jgi:CubicO group peptidase (beta-lactamase class C family)